jgi:2TM domain-containing protein
VPLIDEERLTEPSAGDDDSLRRQAIRQIQRRRHFHVEALVSAIGMAVLVLIWAVSEYHNAGGWPTQGFSQSSGIHDVWNYWIVYPLGAWLLILGARAWMVYGRGHEPISEAEITNEIERQRRRH